VNCCGEAPGVNRGSSSIRHRSGSTSNLLILTIVGCNVMPLKASIMPYSVATRQRTRKLVR
jgi:hypothetical protein